MAGEWNTVALGDVADTRNGAGIKQGFFGLTGVPLARVSDFTEWSIDITDCVRVDIEHSKRWERHRLKEGDVVVATVGSWPPNWSSVVGKAVRVPQSAAGAIQNQNTCCIFARPGITDQRFLFYLLRTEAFVHYAANAAAGSASQARLPVASLERFVFALPPLPEQCAIGHILGTLDDKIELNRRMNKTLEAMARGLFKSWFVDFEPVRAKAEGHDSGLPKPLADLFPNSFVDSALGEIPKGWQARPLNEVLKEVNERAGGADVPEYSSTNDGLQPRSERFTKKLSVSNANNKVIRRGCLVFGLSRRVLNFGLMREEIGSVSPAYRVLAVDHAFIMPDLLEQMMRMRPAYFYNALSASSREGQSVSLEGLGVLCFVQPSKAAQEAYYRSTDSLSSRARGLENESQTLAALRDALLPKLISGELRINADGPYVEKATR